MSDKPHINRKHLHKLLKKMLRIRRFEEKCAELYSQQKIRGFLHLYIGEEAISVGAMEALEKEDQIVATYREHGHALGRDIAMGPVLAELYGKSNGCSRGRGGSMHIFDREAQLYGGNAIVAGGLPLATGLAMANKKLGRSAIAACFFGEGAAAEGEFHESLNLAALWQLPVLFICENNQYAMGTALQYSESEMNIARKAGNYGLESQQVDGMNVVEVEIAVREATEYIRANKKPYFLECLTYRFCGHSSFDSQLYREKTEIKQWEEKGPIKQLINWMSEYDYIETRDIETMEDDIQQEISEAIAFAESGEWEPVEDLCKDVYTPMEAGGKS